jgi:hypothetical protein
VSSQNRHELQSEFLISLSHSAGGGGKITACQILSPCDLELSLAISVGLLMHRIDTD